MMRNVSRPAYTSMVASTSTVNGIGRIKPAQQVTRSWPKTDIAEQALGRSDGNPTHLDFSCKAQSAVSEKSLVGMR